MIRPAPTDPPEIDSVLWANWHGDIGWDIGANCGQSIKHMTKSFKRVHAFEPNPDAINMLLACEFEREGVVVHELAVSDHNGTVQLAALPNLMETGQLATPGTHGMEWDPEGRWPEVPTVIIPCKSVDSLAYDLGVPDFIKVDTEGHEAYILDGAYSTLTLGHTDWLIEFHSPGLRQACLERLARSHYLVETIRHPHYPYESHMWHQHGWLRCKAPKGSNA